MISSLKQNSRIAAALLILMFLVVFLLCFKSANSVLASLNFYGAKNYIEEWERLEEAPNTVQLQAAEQYAINAIELHPSFALYTDTLSTVLQWQALNNKNFEETIVLLNEAENLNLQSTLNRPAWPVTWANLAYIKWLKGEIDDSFSNYLNNASLLGPNNPDVHKAVAQIGLSLAKTDVRRFLQHKGVISKHVTQGLSHPRSRKAIKEIILSTGTRAMVDQWVKASPKNKDVETNQP